MQLQEYLHQRTIHDVPLLRVSDQSHIIYQKGALAMYALREYVGEERVNAALRHFLEAHRYAEPPYPTSLDLYEELQAVTPDSLQYLLADLFEKDILWDLQATDARVEPTDTGAYRVTLQIVARKVEPDSVGREIEVPMDDWVEIGVFAAAERGLGEPLHFGKHRIRSGEQTITLTVPQEPARAGIDPYHLLIDRDLKDNMANIE